MKAGRSFGFEVDSLIIGSYRILKRHAQGHMCSFSHSISRKSRCLYFHRSFNFIDLFDFIHLFLLTVHPLLHSSALIDDNFSCDYDFCCLYQTCRLKKSVWWQTPWPLHFIPPDFPDNYFFFCLPPKSNFLQARNQSVQQWYFCFPRYFYFLSKDSSWLMFIHF